ncbi:aldehyde dehydrogenase (NADP(+)) [Rhodococcus sp. 06-412-2C]|uniref:aldehyde dehydrogenase (NADP(+)) n=1 Tax=unclassified Rhodococcus (in: high G+C Gram-positive bacteria) TaxID=192944 RepID=UPI000B9A7D22|nr:MULTISPECIES: aldehyde dehydrogenase (NADP(+)) [unclassified Rhodococcus (in: high G+C Gram-positive bacteria)]OZC83953.1 aldehyde dehydrogenase (NADP(+)) [Rhodococcus sp. 06-412-2C]OZC94141.1 aldehyde dehydrogenase (NADP(+)) [Rhodococcus sp. 06-412-2B]
MTTIAGTNPRTGGALADVAKATSDADVDRIVSNAASAAPAFAALARSERADVLDAIAIAIEARTADLLDIAMQETGFTESKLSGELIRTAYQFRFFADVAREGSYLEATIDPPAQTPMGPRPDLRRWLVPIGPIAVFGASNFPFAFSVLGGDTASALAAGNPVVVKAHGSHPATSLLSFQIMEEALTAVGLASATVGIVFGTSGGARLVSHDGIKAVGFTGSLSGGRALLDIIHTRAEPIPFYGELSSLNPVLVSPSAAAQGADDIGTGLVTSFTVGSGQLCTKPGFVLVPRGAHGDRLVEAARDALARATDHVLLNERIYATYQDETNTLATKPDVLMHSAPDSPRAGFRVTPRLVETQIEKLDPSIVHEIFGPVAVIARYDGQQLLSVARSVFDSFPASLTATLHVTEDDDIQALTDIASERAGRVLFGGFPTGVAVSWAQTHGGPWPSTNSIHTSVGATAIRRFIRPLTYQNAPHHVLPMELRDGYRGIPRRIDGVQHSANT